MELIHTCYRITDIDRSVAFYEALGFEERGRLPIGDEAVNVFMGLPGDADRLELTYNFGVDSYEIGTGYGHIAVTVDDLDATLERLAGQGIEPERPPYSVREGGSRLCFVRDPDEYRIELIERRGLAAQARSMICRCHAARTSRARASRAATRSCNSSMCARNSFTRRNASVSALKEVFGSPSSSASRCSSTSSSPLRMSMHSSTLFEQAPELRLGQQDAVVPGARRAIAP